MARPRIISVIAIKWEANPFHELCKLKASELGIKYSEAVKLIKLQDELAQLTFKG